jgi:hypothetical protein
VHPFGGYPGFVSLITKKFKRADEKAWLIGLSYDFGEVGLMGVRGAIEYARGSTPKTGRNASPNQDELDITIDYRPKESFLKGLWFRMRGGFVDQ